MARALTGPHGTSVALVSPTQKRLDADYDLSSMDSGATQFAKIQAALDDSATWSKLVFRDGIWLPSNAGTGLVWPVVSNKEICGESNRGACQILRANTDDVPCLTMEVDPGGEAMTNVAIRDLGLGFETQRPGTQTNAAALAYTQTSSSPLGIASSYFERLYFKFAAQGFAKLGAGLQLGMFQNEFNDIYGQGISYSFMNFESPVTVGSTNNTGRKWHLNNNGQGLAIAYYAVSIAAEEWFVDDMDFEGNDEDVVSGRGRLLNCVGDTDLVIGLFRAENWGLPSGENGGTLIFPGDSNLTIMSGRMTFSPVALGGGNCNLFYVSSVGRLWIGSWYQNHSITSGAITFLEGDGTGPDIHVGRYKAGAGAATIASATVMPRIRHFDGVDYLRSKAGTPTDSDLVLDANGASILNTSDGKVYVRTAAATWTAQT